MPELLEPDSQEGLLVPDPITGTNSEKIDKLIAAVADLRLQISDLKGDLGARIAGVKSDLESRIAGVKSDLETRIAGVKSDLESRIADVKGEVGAIKAVNRTLGAIFILCLPSLFLLNAFVIRSTLDNSVELRAISAQLGRIEGAQKESDRELRDRLTQLEATVNKK